MQQNKTIDSYPEIMTAANISEYLHISRRRVYELLKMKPEAGGIPSFSIGDSKRAKRSDFVNWLEKQIQR